MVSLGSLFAAVSEVLGRTRQRRQLWLIAFTAAMLWAVSPAARLFQEGMGGYGPYWLWYRNDTDAAAFLAFSAIHLPLALASALTTIAFFSGLSESCSSDEAVSRFDRYVGRRRMCAAGGVVLISAAVVWFGGVLFELGEGSSRIPGRIVMLVPSLVCFYAWPVIAVEQLDAMGAMRRSASLVRRTIGPIAVFALLMQVIGTALGRAIRHAGREASDAESFFAAMSDRSIVDPLALKLSLVCVWLIAATIIEFALYRAAASKAHRHAERERTRAYAD